MITALSWIANLLILAGAWGIAYRYRSAFVSSLLGNLLYIFTALTQGNIPLAALATVLAVLAVIGFIKWGREHRKWEGPPFLAMESFRGTGPRVNVVQAERAVRIDHE